MPESNTCSVVGIVARNIQTFIMVQADELAVEELPTLIGTSVAVPQLHACAIVSVASLHIHNQTLSANPDDCVTDEAPARIGVRRATSSGLHTGGVGGAAVRDIQAFPANADNLLRFGVNRIGPHRPGHCASYQQKTRFRPNLSHSRAFSSPLSPCMG